jgi:hypothetical protein
MSASELYAAAQKIYDERLGAGLETSHPNYFVAIEPKSGDYFLGSTLSEASAAAHASYPERRTCVLRIGHPTTVDIGAVNPWTAR